MNEEYNNYYGKQSWTFHIQSTEDFYNQLRAYHREDYAREQAVDLEDLTLAQDMLRSIGVNV